jgi:hypothetical protein
MHPVAFASALTAPRLAPLHTGPAVEQRPQLLLRRTGYPNRRCPAAVRGRARAVRRHLRAQLGDENNNRAAVDASDGAQQAAHGAVERPSSEGQGGDPVAARVRQELADEGINMDDLLDAGKVVRLTRDLDALALKLYDASHISADDREELERNTAELRAKLATGKRQVMQQWLKRLFLGQAVVFVVLGGILSTNHIPGVSDVPLVGQALGFWMTWLFVIPSLRARKGMRKDEKSALNIAFVGTPLMNIALPLLTKDCGVIWSAGLLFLVAAYARYGAFPGRYASLPSPELVGENDAGDSDTGGKAKTGSPETARIKGILKYLDWGSWR